MKLSVALTLMIVVFTASIRGQTTKNTKGQQTIALVGKFLYPHMGTKDKSALGTRQTANIKIVLTNPKSRAVLATTTTDDAGVFHFPPVPITPGMSIGVGPAAASECECCGGFNYVLLPADENCINYVEAIDPPFMCSKYGPLIAFSPECNCTFPPCTPPCPGDIDPGAAFSALQAFSNAVEARSVSIGSARVKATTQLRVAHASAKTIETVMNFLEFGRDHSNVK